MLVHSCAINNDIQLLNLIQKYYPATSSLDDSLLHGAIFHLLNEGKTSCIVPLAKKVDDLNAYTSLGETLLHWAASYKNHELAEFLLDNGVDANLFDAGNKKALNYAVERLDIQLVQKIVRNTDLNQKMPYSGMPYVYSILSTIDRINDLPTKRNLLNTVLKDSNTPIKEQFAQNIINLPICFTDDVAMKICEEALIVE